MVHNYDWIRVNYWSFMSLSLFASVSDGKLTKHFTYHILLDSYFGGHSVAHENLKFLSQPSDDFPIAYQPLKKPDLDHLGHFLP